MRAVAGCAFGSSGLSSLSLSGLGGQTALIAPSFSLSSSLGAPDFGRGPLAIFLSLEPVSGAFDMRAGGFAAVLGGSRGFEAALALLEAFLLD